MLLLLSFCFKFTHFDTKLKVFCLSQISKRISSSFNPSTAELSVTSTEEVEQQEEEGTIVMNMAETSTLSFFGDFS